MVRDNISRRDLLRSTAVVGAASAAGLWTAHSAEARRARTRAAAAGPMLSHDEMAAIDPALGKKGTVVADQSIYTVPLPRADLKVKFKYAPVPTGFGFGGWVAFQIIPDGRA